MRVLTGYEQEAMELTTQESEAEYNRERYAAEFTEVTLYCNCGATKTVKLIDPFCVEEDDNPFTCNPCLKRAYEMGAYSYGKQVAPPDDEDVPF